MNRISDDLMSTLVNLSGNLKDIACGTHIKIPTDSNLENYPDVGFVSYYKSAEGFETLTLNLREAVRPDTRKMD